MSDAKTAIRIATLNASLSFCPIGAEIGQRLSPAAGIPLEAPRLENFAKPI
jgi:hypothetical protein